MLRCTYDACHEFEGGSWNAAYCPDCSCKRKREASVKRLSAPVTGDAELWQLQEDRKMGKLLVSQEKNDWILKNKSFAMFDLETSNLDANFGEILCGCIKPLYGKITTFAIPTFEAGDPWTLISDNEVAVQLRDELRKYDYIVTWFGTRFDMPYLTTRLIDSREEKIGPIRHLDLYYTSRWKLKLHSNRLAAVGDFLFGKTKKDNYAGNTWMQALRGHKPAIDYVVKHCEKDVEELERVFEELAPFRNIAATALKDY